ncbi:MAG: nitrate reductase subunit beta, partial [Candidatus Marinimicrobia bacterium]|nr:nitrate reductase subunit beta [Candidatus Neomarinimicrobiota bacterium]
KKPDLELVDAQRDMILDPFDEDVIKEAKKNGIADSTIKAAQNSPVYKFVKEWGVALPPHVEYRTLPMLFYVPPMLPVMSAQEGGSVRSLNEEYFPDFDKARVPIKYLASMFGGGNESHLRYVLRKQSAIRAYRRALTVGDVDLLQAEKSLLAADCNPKEAEEMYKLTSLCTFEERFVIPAAHREEAIEMMKDPLEHKQEMGFGFRDEPERGM